MKLLYVTTALPYGAQEAFIIAELLALRALGHEIVIVPRSPGNTIINNDAKELNDFTVSTPLFSISILIGAIAQTCIHPLVTLKSVALLFQSTSVRAVFVNLAVWPKALWMAGVVKKYQVQHIHAHWAATTSTMAMIASMLSDIPWSFTAHRGDVVADNLLNQKCRRAQFVRAISKQTAKLLEDRCNESAKPSKCQILHMGVDIPRTISKHLMDNQQPIVACPANLFRVKGHAVLLQAWHILQQQLEAMLWIIGDGPLQPQLEKQAKQLAIKEQVDFCGRVSHDRILDWYREGKFALVVLPSLELPNNEHEGIPVSLIEALSFGIPVVSTNSGGIPELLGDIPGTLVPPGDPDALASAIHNLLTNGLLRANVIAAERNMVEREFNILQTVSSLTDLFKRHNNELEV